MESELNYTRGEKNGICRWYFESGKMSGEIEYLNGRGMRERYWNEDGSVQKNKDQVTQEPEYPGGIEQFRKEISENSIYPESAKARKIEGKVLVKFIIQKDGYVANIGVVKSVDPDLDKEALRVIKLILKDKKFQPAKSHNKPSECRFIQGVLFKL